MDIKKLQDLFKAGITKEEFIKKANQIKSESSEESIFNESNASEIFDLLNTTKSSDGKEVLDANEISALAKFDESDGKSSISDKDLKVLYNKIAEKNGKKLDDPEKMFNKNVKSNSDTYGSDLDDYIISLNMQISNIDNLITVREANSKNIIETYSDKIDELIADSKQLDSEFKAEYKKKKQELAEAKKKYDENESKIAEKKKEIEEINNSIKQANFAKENGDSENDNSETDDTDYNAQLQASTDEYNALISNQTKYSKDIDDLNSNIETAQKTATKRDKTIKSKVEDYQSRIKQEKKSLDADIASYKGIKGRLEAARNYAIQQLEAQSAAQTSSYSDEDTSNWTQDAQTLKAKWSKKGKNLSDGFYSKVVAVAKRLNCDPNALMGIMNSESGLNPQAVNKSSGASGLIQFMPSTAKAYGTSTSAIRNMSAEEQLNLVEQFLKKNKKAAGFSDGEKLSAGQLYALVFLPARAHRETLTSSGENYYAANKGLDTNKDGKITTSDLDARVKKMMA